MNPGKLAIILIFAFTLPIANKVAANQKDDRCDKLNNFIQDSIKLIERSELAEANTLSCNELRPLQVSTNTLAIKRKEKR